MKLNIKKYFTVQYGALLLIFAALLPGCTGGDTATETADAIDRVGKLTFSQYSGSYDRDIEVEISCETEGADIYYTTNGDTPSNTSMTYNGAIPVSGHGTEMTIKAVAMKEGLRNSSLYSLTYEINYDRVSTPQFDKKTGTYAYDIEVTITCPTEGASIYYTTDDTEPDESSFLYTGPLEISGDGTSTILKAVAVKDQKADSDIQSARYKIEHEFSATPVLTPAGGTFDADQEVEITTSTEGADIYYTIDGSAPGTNSRKYENPISVAGDGTQMTIKAISAKEGLQNSETASEDYIISYRVEDPDFSHFGGTYDDSIDVTITTDTAGADIYYTTDGTNPTSSSTYYNGTAVTINSDTTLKAVAVKQGNQDSGITEAVYTIDSTQVSAPTFDIKPGEYNTTQSVTITCETSGAEIYYTTDGTDPTVFSSQYSTSIAITESDSPMTLKAIATKYGQDDSDIVGGEYIINPKAENPSFDKESGKYDTDITVALSVSDGSAIYYTTDGSTPTENSTEYTSPISVSGDGTLMTIKAVAVKSGSDDSDVVVRNYEIDTGTAAAPEFNYPSGTYTHDLTVEITTTTNGADIHYTTDGSEPTTSSTPYSSPVSVNISGHNTSKTIKAIAVKSDMDDSPVSEASYTIQYEKVAAPEFSITPGTYNQDKTLQFTCPTAGATIEYRAYGGAYGSGTDGTYDENDSNTWVDLAGPSETYQVRAVATKTGMLDSDVITGDYTIYVFTDHIIVAGEYHNGTNYDWLIKKYDTGGNEDTDNWDLTFDSGNDDSARAVAIDSNNNVYVAGTMKTLRGYEWWIKKFDQSGNEDLTNWNKIIDDGTSTGKDYVKAMAIDGNNNIYIAGSKDSQWWIKKFNSAGTEDTVDWNKLVGGDNGDDMAYSIAIDSGNNVIVAGTYHYDHESDPENNPPDISKDWMVEMYTPDGQLLWSETSGDNTGDHTANAVTVNGNDEIYVGGFYYDITNSNNNWRLHSYNYNNGAVTDLTGTWSNMPSSTAGNEAVYSMTSHLTDVYIAGTASNNTWGDSDWYINKYSGGAYQWTQQSSGTLGTPYSIKAYSNGSHIVVAGSQTVTGNGKDWWIRKLETASSGSQQWAITAGGTGDDTAYGIDIFN